MIRGMERFNHTILQIIPTLDAGGAERTTLEIAAAIARTGGRALVASRGGRLATNIELAGGEVILMPVHSKSPATMWLNVQRITALIKKYGIDLIHARSRAPAWSALVAARKAGIPFVTTYHGAYNSAGPVKRYYNSSMLRADCVIANSRYTGDAIARLGGVPPERLRVIPRGADLDYFDPSKVSAKRINHVAGQWGQSDGEAPDGDAPGENGRFRVLLPGRLTPWKGHEVAIEAAALHKSDAATGKAADLTLVFCGGAQGQSGYERELRAMIDQRGVRDMVHLVGDCADMAAAYGWADVVIAPSTRPEAFGRVAIEAGAMEKPVIAAAHGGAMETIVDGESGILIKPGDAGALAQAIGRVQHMSSYERAVMGENGRARAASVYSAAAMCDATLRVYSDLLAGRG
jgi:glycosyltransferase involved in cell wall biosynthesis